MLQKSSSVAPTHNIRNGVLFLLLILLLASTGYLWLEARYASTPTLADSSYTTNVPEPFPVGVHPDRKEIVELPTFNPYIEQHFSELQRAPTRLSFLREYITTAIRQTALYQHVASPSSRTLIISPGDHPRAVFERIYTLFAWEEEERVAFTNIIYAGIHTHSVPPIIPGTYTLPRQSSPIAVYDVLESSFMAELKSRYPDSTEAVVPLRDAVIIASLLEREAADFYDMRYISGVIWNRRFIDMNLQIDATLQYAKTIAADSTKWPMVTPDDKYIESPFNTYEHPDLPPAPIAIPSVAAVIASLNPRQTDCLFYFHSQNRSFFCSVTYEEHVEKLIQQYGRGR